MEEFAPSPHPAVRRREGDDSFTMKEHENAREELV